jgi:hypothetical protein
MYEWIALGEPDWKKGADEDIKPFISIWRISYFLWCVVGLMTSQWFLFITLFTSRIPGIFGLRKFSSFLGLIILALILINKYHIQFNFTEWVLG